MMHGEEGGKNPKNYGHYGHYGHMNPNFDEKNGQTSYYQGNTEAEADEDEKKLALTRYSSANWDMLQLRKIPTSWL